MVPMRIRENSALARGVLFIHCVSLLIAVLFAGFVAALFTACPAYAADSGEVDSIFTVECAVNDESGELVGKGSLTLQVTVAAADGMQGEAKIISGKDYAGELIVDKVSQTIDGVELSYAVTAVGTDAFMGNDMLTGVTFRSDLTGSFPAVGGSTAGGTFMGAFMNCTALAQVSFECVEVNGIGDCAFAGCTRLAAVTFSELESREFSIRLRI